MNSILNEWFGEEVCEAYINIDEFLSHAKSEEVSHEDEDALEQMYAATDEEMLNMVNGNDDTLGRMFTETDEEMLNIVEDQFTCRGCNLKFLNEENYKIHQDRCMNKLQNFNCSYCNRKFNREMYKNLHQKHCDRNTNVQSRPMKQLKLDRPEHSLSVMQVGGSSNLSDGSSILPKQIKSSLSNNATVYRKQFDVENRTHLMDRMEIVISTFREIIEKELKKINGMKYYFTLRIMFHQGKDPSILTDPPISFRSEVFTALNSEKFHLNAKVAAQQFQQQIDQFQRNGSGWVINHFIDMDIGKLIKTVFEIC